MNNLSLHIVSTIKQLADDMLLSFITLKAKNWTYVSSSASKNKSEWTLCYLLSYTWTNSDQAQALEVTVSWIAKSYHSQTVFQQYIKNLSE